MIKKIIFLLFCCFLNTQMQTLAGQFTCDNVRSDCRDSGGKGCDRESGADKDRPCDSRDPHCRGSSGGSFATCDVGKAGCSSDKNECKDSSADRDSNRHDYSAVCDILGPIAGGLCDDRDLCTPDKCTPAPKDRESSSENRVSYPKANTRGYSGFLSRLWLGRSLDSDDDEEVTKYKEEIAQQQHTCFAPETLIWTPVGLTPLHKLKQGDLVYSLDPSTGDFTTNSVQTVLKRRVENHLEITVNGHTLATTEDHPFYLHKGTLCAAKDLQVDDVLCNAFEPAPCIEAVDYIDAPLDVINLTLDAPHTFFICPDPNATSYEEANALLLVHNCNPIASIAEAAVLVAPPVIKGAARPIAGLAKRMIAQIKHSNQKAYIEHLTKTAKPGPKNSQFTTQFEKTGGFKQANKDFDALNLSNIRHMNKSNPNQVGRIGTLKDGRTVIVRNFSSDKTRQASTLEFQDGQIRIKFRYPE